MQTIICPECGADVFVESPSAKFLICPSCGARVKIGLCAVTDSPKPASASEEYHQRVYEEALRKLNRRDALKKRFWHFCRTRPKKALLTVGVCVVLFFAGGTAWSNHVAKQQEQLRHQAQLVQLQRESIGYSHLANGEVQMPDIEIGMATDYRIVKQDFENAGFVNITTEPVADLNNTVTARYNTVIEVTIDGVPRMKVGSWYKMDVPIVITYHTVK